MNFSMLSLKHAIYICFNYDSFKIVTHNDVNSETSLLDILNETEVWDVGVSV